MNSFYWNLFEVNVIIVLLFIGYLVIRNRLSFKQQRAVLLSLPFVALAAVLIKSLIDVSAVSYSIPIVKLAPIFVGNPQGAMPVNEFALSLTSCYGIGVILIAAVLIFRLVKLSLFFVRNISENRGKYRIYKVQGKASFSFFNRIQITPSLSAEQQEIVLEHEKMHVDKKHSIDTVLVELLHVLFWFNPIFIFIKRELINLHEYEVDALMYKKHKVDYLKFLVNYALGVKSSHYLLTSRFYNQLTLKKRVEIMKKNIRKQSWMLSIIPIIGIAAILFHPSETIAETPEENVFDFAEVYPELDAETARNASELDTGTVRKASELDAEIARRASELDTETARRASELDTETARNASELDAEITRNASELDAEITRRASELDTETARRASELDAEITRKASELDAETRRD